MDVLSDDREVILLEEEDTVDPVQMALDIEEHSPEDPTPSDIDQAISDYAHSNKISSTEFDEKRVAEVLRRMFSESRQRKKISEGHGGSYNKRDVITKDNDPRMWKILQKKFYDIYYTQYDKDSQMGTFDHELRTKYGVEISKENRNRTFVVVNPSIVNRLTRRSHHSLSENFGKFSRGLKRMAASLIQSSD